jgi:hypothetical protein
MKHDNIVNTLIGLARDNMATNTELKSYHAAALVRKGCKAMTFGVNSPRTYIKGRTSMSMHAEEAALYALYGRHLTWRGRWFLPLKVA